MTVTRRALLSAAATALAAGVVLSASPAQAANPTLSSVAADALAASLGDTRTAGVFVAAGRSVVNVTDAGAAAQVRAAGGVARLVSRSTSDLHRLLSTLDAGVPGTAWGVDPVGNQVVVSVDTTVSAAGLGSLRAAAARSGGAVRVEQVSGRFTPLIGAGDAIYGGGFRCSLGFNVRSGGTNSFLTAGHCADEAREWFADASHSTKLGDRAGTSFPGNDYGIVRYTNTSITVSGGFSSAANPVVGQSVTRRGSTTGTHSGTVTALNVTVHYASGGTVRQMIQTNVCAEPGDSGGPLFSGNVALGLTSGGSGNCRVGGTTFYQPVTEALSRFGVSVF